MQTTDYYFFGTELTDITDVTVIIFLEQKAAAPVLICDIRALNSSDKARSVGRNALRPYY